MNGFTNVSTRQERARAQLTRAAFHSHECKALVVKAEVMPYKPSFMGLLGPRRLRVFHLWRPSARLHISTMLS